MKKFFYCILTTILLLSCMCVSIFADDKQKASEVKIDGLQQGEQFRVWKVVDINYNPTTNSYTTEFNSNFSSFFNGQSINISTFQNYADNSNEINSILKELPKYIEANPTLTPIETFTVGSTETSHTLTNVDAGGYFIQPVNTGRIYQTMFIEVAPVIDSNSYVVKSVTYNAKHSDVTISKEVSNNGADFGDTASVSVKTVDEANSVVTFKIKIGVPKYVSAVTDKIVMKVEDTIPADLSYVDNSLNCSGIDSGSNYTDLDSNKYSFSKSSNSLTVDFSGEKYSNISYFDYIEIKYQCELISATAFNSGNSITNIAKYTYSKYPYISNQEKETTDYADVKTYAATITKQDKDDNGIKLSGAQFDLYREAIGSESCDTTFTQDSTTVNLHKISGPYTTDSNGNFSINGLKPGDYYLFETKAPHGYAHDETPVKLTIVETQTENATLTIKNTKALLTLPTTGSSGMMIFTVAGIVLMMSAIVIILVSSIKGNKVQK